MHNIKSQIEAGAPANAVQQISVKTVAKFIIVEMHGREQVVIFPFAIQHAEMLSRIQRTHQNMAAISAGFFIGDFGTLWAGGESTSLELSARPQDLEIIRAFLANPLEQFDFITGGAQ
jgi:hypothetical protein